MSFAAQTKKELTMIESESCCEKAELSALMRMNGSVQLSSNRKVILDISTENAAIARRIYTLVKTYFQVHTELLVRKKMRLKKNNVYIVRIPTRVQEILRDLHIVSEGFLFTDGINEQIVENNCCKRAYLRGAFMAGGSVNNPEGSSYHLEISSMYEEHCRALVELANEFQLNARFIERKKGFVLYIKEGEKIIEFLNIIGAHQALFKFEDVRIMRDMRNSVNRIVNCETANLNKTIGAAVRQIENIRYLERHLGLEKLPDKLREVAEVRLAHPDINLKEVGELLSGKVSKSGVNHRLRKIDEMAERLRNG
ncbi:MULTISPECIES: DNA-binding protein WhiA [Paenibacillus]|uniref:Probable cell division protein WhiA n=1 Tax=Paenibacillus alvei TaxID=44250 RepID=A0AAP7DK02_PAEAL|nr:MULTISPECIES: DNA-binding protein WhiA [Paenibacillus]MBG9733569.1 sporulation regulator WhiA [Paenibacillus alvei]MBG9745066.1 sporulation regulator WhiA [Paenibacillus alvei]MCY7484371.1 DNA-binding protein WhiA [Paenibacillus alvei]MCY9582800.1 DNA-binding protein WhiA [Paenibacillus alvei]MCY9587425.1 DNA-binding protein WhiA [Paenibacillus alvei]